MSRWQYWIIQVFFQLLLVAIWIRGIVIRYMKKYINLEKRSNKYKIIIIKKRSVSKTLNYIILNFYKNVNQILKY